jgi:hypothetical protein
LMPFNDPHTLPDPLCGHGVTQRDISSNVQQRPLTSIHVTGSAWRHGSCGSTAWSMARPCATSAGSIPSTRSLETERHNAEAVG